MSEASGWLWLLINVLFVVVLAAALLWGSIMWRSRRRNPRTEQATRELYRRGAESERSETPQDKQQRSAGGRDKVA